MIRSLCDDFLQAIEAQFTGVPTMIGTPFTGQTSVAVPVAALEFVSLGEYSDPKPAPRLGDSNGPGLTIFVNLYLFALDEAQLLDIMAEWAAIRAQVSRVGSWVVRYGTAERYNDGSNNDYLRFAVMTPVSFSVANYDF